MALTSGLLASYLAVSYLRRNSTRILAVEPPKHQIVVATKDLPLGSLLRAEDVRLQAWPGDALPAGYASSIADVVGRGIITPVRLNEPLLDSKIAAKDSGGGLPIIIPEGMRALSVRVDEVVGVAGFVLPGTRVDVLLTMPAGEAQGDEAKGSITRIVLQNIQVLAAGQTIQKDAEGKPQVVQVMTLLVDPAQAERLTLASGVGKIQMALRNMLDVDTARTSGVRSTQLIQPPSASRGPTRAVVVRSRAPTRPTEGSSTTSPQRSGAVVEIYKGGVRTLSTFSSDRNE
jgi:pilus assembly protein CpaB